MRTAVNTGYQTAFTVSAGFVALATILALMLRVPKDDPEDAVMPAPIPEA